MAWLQVDMERQWVRRCDQHQCTSC